MWFFKCFLNFIHLLLYLKSVIVILFQQIRRYFSVTSRTCIHGEIREDSKDLAKLPRHISFVVLESNISFVDLASLIVWSMALGIPYISVYDREGRLFKLLCLYDAIHSRHFTPVKQRSRLHVLIRRSIFRSTRRVKEKNHSSF